MSIHALILMAALTPAANDPQLTLAPGRITLSGVSSGGYAAQQIHLAYPELFHGIGVVAGGPWGCAGGDLATAMGRCMGNDATPLDVTALLAKLESTHRDLAAVRDDPVWLFRGARDAMVAAGVAEATHALYSRLSDHVVYIGDVDAAHHFPTIDQGPPCDQSTSPFYAACNYDTAGKILTHLYGKLNPPAETLSGIKFQAAVDGADAAHLEDTATLYIPAACETGACGVHVVLHGCAQAVSAIGEKFIDHAGYNRWADSNRLVMVYPQVKPSAVNPYGCWDWWGYTGTNYLQRGAPQTKAVVDLVFRLGCNKCRREDSP